MKPLSIDDIKKICINICRAYPYHERYRLNTFAVIEQGLNDWSAKNFNKGATDVADSNYWVRNKDFSVDDLRMSGVLAMEHKKTTMVGYNDNRMVLEVFFQVGLVQDCETCDEAVSSRKLFEQSMLIMRNFLKEFLEYRAYLVSTDGGVTNSEVWLSPSSSQHFLNEGVYTEAHESGMAIKNYIIGIHSADNDLYELNLSGTGYVGCATKLRIETCDPIDAITFDYGSVDAAQGAVTICSDCG